MTGADRLNTGCSRRVVAESGGNYGSRNLLAAILGLSAPGAPGTCNLKYPTADLSRAMQTAELAKRMEPLPVNGPPLFVWSSFQVRGELSYAREIS